MNMILCSKTFGVKIVFVFIEASYKIIGYTCI